MANSTIMTGTTTLTMAIGKMEFGTGTIGTTMTTTAIGEMENGTGMTDISTAQLQVKLLVKQTM